MEARQARTWRGLMGKLGMAVCIVAFLAVADGLVKNFREPINVVQGLAGQSLHVDGPLEEDVRSPGDVGAIVDSARLKVTVEEVHRGYFLGGARWRGRVAVAPGTPPGKYGFVVHARKAPAREELAFRVVVHPDAASLRASSQSLIQRHFDIHPWLVAITFLPVILLAFGGVFWFSRRYERLLHREGRAEIYRITNVDGQTLIAFELGEQDGVRLGDTLAVQDEEGRTLGTVEVEEVSATDASGTAMLERPLTPGSLVSRRR